MSWLDKVLPKISRSNGETAKKDIPAGVWTKCSNCGTTLYAQELRDNLNVCPKCNHHMRVSARQRLDMILDPENRQEIGAEIRPVDPLGFVDSKKYPDRVKQAQSASGETDALVVQSGPLSLPSLNSVLWPVPWARLSESALLVLFRPLLIIRQHLSVLPLPAALVCRKVFSL
jgi:acetyl-CoA carboxylase beta subunit